MIDKQQKRRELTFNHKTKRPIKWRKNKSIK